MNKKYSSREFPCLPECIDWYLQTISTFSVLEGHLSDSVIEFAYLNAVRIVYIAFWYRMVGTMTVCLLIFCHF